MRAALPWVFVLALLVVGSVILMVCSFKEEKSQIKVGDHVFFGKVFGKVIALSSDGEVATVVTNGSSIANTFKCFAKDLRPQLRAN